VTEIDPAAPWPGPVVWVLRHGATEWAESGRHTGRTDLPLDDRGLAEAEALGRVLNRKPFDRVLVSPLQRARTTCELAGYGNQAEICDDLVEWDYGEYEGLTTSQIRREVPDWTVWTGGCPGGETIDQVAARADRVIAALGGSGAAGSVALFAHGHILRILAARWLGLAPTAGSAFALDTATVSTLGWEHEYPTILRWNSR
jgi:broad specificity phosphatase PhoE